MSDPAPGRPPQVMTVRPPLTPLRTFFAILGGLILTVAGGCSLVFAPAAWNYGIWIFVPLYGGIPIALGALILWLALRWDRGESGGAHHGEGETND